MSRALISAATILVLLFSAAMTLTHAQSVEPMEVRVAATQLEPCADPCFLGRRMLFLSVPQADDLLRRSDWIDQIRISSLQDTITWTWSGRQPDFIDAKTPGYMHADPTAGVNFVSVRTTIPVSSLWLTYGIPPIGFIAREPGRMLHVTVYPDAAFSSVTETTCPASIPGFSNTPVTLVWADPLFHDSTLRQGYLSRWRSFVAC